MGARGPCLYGQTAEDYLSRAKTKASKNDFSGAVADCTKAIKLKPDYAEAYRLRGGYKGGLRAPDSNGRIEDYSKAISLKPGYDEAYWVRGSEKQQRGDIEGAIEDYTKVIEIKPTVAGYLVRGRARQQKADLAGAVADFTAATQAAVANGLPLTVYERSEAGDMRPGPFRETGLSDALVAMQDRAKAYRLLGSVKQSKGDLAGADAANAKAAQNTPGSEAFYTSLILGGELSSEGLLIEALNKGHSLAMANALLNCGNPRLEDAASAWAKSIGASIVKVPGEGNVKRGAGQ